MTEDPEWVSGLSMFGHAWRGGAIVTPDPMRLPLILVACPSCFILRTTESALIERRGCVDLLTENTGLRGLVSDAALSPALWLDARGQDPDWLDEQIAEAKSAFGAGFDRVWTGSEETPRGFTPLVGSPGYFAATSVSRAAQGAGPPEDQISGERLLDGPLANHFRYGPGGTRRLSLDPLLCARAQNRMAAQRLLLAGRVTLRRNSEINLRVPLMGAGSRTQVCFRQLEGAGHVEVQGENGVIVEIMGDPGAPIAVLDGDAVRQPCVDVRIRGHRMEVEEVALTLPPTDPPGGAIVADPLSQFGDPLDAY